MGRESASSETFASELQAALQHLYDPAKLRTSPLLAHFAAEGERNPVAALQRTLTNAIQRLQPNDQVPAHAEAWRIYQVLTYRYVEQLSQRETAIDLAVSVRQLRRHEKVAVRVLADYLQDHYQLRLAFNTRPTPSLKAQATEGGLQASHAEAVSREDELEWLQESLPSGIAGTRRVVETALRPIRPLAESLGVQITCSICNDLPGVSGPLCAMRQALVSLLTAVVQAVPGGQLRIGARVASGGVEVRLRAMSGPVGPSLLHRDLAETFSMARELARLYGGSVDLLSEGGQQQALVASLTLPAAEQIRVLVVDDNADTLLLLERYLAETRYSFVGTCDPEEALVMAEQLAPPIIVVDVMLPTMDGWEFLSRLREHPKTQCVPVLVCTILPQEQLALTLGAAGFLRKPVTRDELLRELDRLVEPCLTVSR